MASELDFPTFYDRFESLRRRLRRSLSWQTLAVLAILTLLSFIAVAALDYRYELPWLVRSIAVRTTLLASLLLAGWLLFTGFRRWSRSRTATVIERRFPELGQRVRTTVLYRGQSPEQLKAAGVAPGLVRALETEAAVSTLPLPIENLIPARRLIALTGLSILILGFVASSALWNSEWQTAIRRTLLADEPFTTLLAGVTDTTVDRGASLSLNATIEGRPRQKVILKTRAITNITADRTAPVAQTHAEQKKPGKGDAGWSTQSFDIEDADHSVQGELAYVASINNVTEPFEYQWIAGPCQSPVYRVDVRNPIEIKAISVDVEPPDYTGLPRAQFLDGNLNVLEGSVARFSIELDGTPSSAKIIVRSIAASRYEEVDAQVVPAQIQGNTIYFEKALTSDFNWNLEADSEQGLPLAQNSYRVRVRKDGPPTVQFEEPNELLDVHPLAEILMRIRVRDDFGLTRAGIVFQINNDEEHTLFAEDYLAAVSDVETAQRPAPRTNGALEGVLPLEHFKLIQKDAITYYGFAEDNRPGGMQRTETELRFIDIRPFKIIYRQPPPNDGDGDTGMQGPRRATFEELIGRQRTALNRTLAMKRNPKQDLAGLDRLMKFETEIAELTNGLAQFLQAQANRFDIPALLDNADLLFQAERSMLDSVDSMSVGKNEVAMLQEKDAVRFLVESRDRLEVILSSGQAAGGLNRVIDEFFRQQQTKLRRRPQQSRENADKARELLDRLAQLAAQQSMSAAELDSLGTDSDPVQGDNPENGQAQTAGTTNSQNGGRAEPQLPMPSTEAADTSGAEKMRPSDSSPGQIDREAIVQTQQDIAAEAADVQRELGLMPEATELAKKRIAAAAESAEMASESLRRGNSRDAAKAAHAAAEKFEQLLTLARGLLAEELSDQLGTARDIADDIARREDDLARSGALSRPKPATDSSEGNSKPQEEMDWREAVARQAQQLAADGESLTDILNSATRSISPEDQKSISRISDLLDRGGLANAIERIQQHPKGIREGKIEDERKAAVELADQLNEAAQELDQLQREIVNPRIATLMGLESKADKLAEELDEIETGRQSEAWHRAVGQFLDELLEETAGENGEDLKEELQAGGWDQERKQLRGAGYDDSRKGKYKKVLKEVANGLREQVQQFLLSQLTSTDDDHPPARYEELVAKFQRVLTKGQTRVETRPRRGRDKNPD